MYLGIDVYARYAQVAVDVDDGNLQDKFRLPNDRLDELTEEYAGSNAAINASGNYRPIYEPLDEYLSVTLANASKNRFIADATVETGRLNARDWLPSSMLACLPRATSRQTRSANSVISFALGKPR